VSLISAMENAGSTRTKIRKYMKNQAKAPAVIAASVHDMRYQTVGAGLIGRASDVTMITKRSNHMPTLTNRHRMNSVTMCRRIGLNHSDSGRMTLQVNMIQNAHQ